MVTSIISFNSQFTDLEMGMLQILYNKPHNTGYFPPIRSVGNCFVFCLFFFSFICKVLILKINVLGGSHHRPVFKFWLRYLLAINKPINSCEPHLIYKMYMVPALRIVEDTNRITDWHREKCSNYKLLFPSLPLCLSSFLWIWLYMFKDGKLRTCLQVLS